MGLIKELMLLPAAPLRFTVWVADQVDEQVQEEHSSSAAIAQRLEEIEQARERGEIDDEQADRLQGEVIEQVTGPATGDEDGHDG
jgi:hypothetical protein